MMLSDTIQNTLNTSAIGGNSLSVIESNSKSYSSFVPKREETKIQISQMVVKLEEEKQEFV